MNQVPANLLFFEEQSGNFSRPSKAQKREARKVLKSARKLERHSAPLAPKNAAQAEFLECLTDSDQVFAIGPAGTGKTYLAARHGIRRVLNGELDKFILTRPFVAIGGESLGFLPGNYIEKAAPWAIPVLEAIREDVNKLELERMLKEEKIEIASFERMRGRTFADSFVLLDEGQNTTVHQMKAFLTRIGENAQVVVSGDYSQSDLIGRRGEALENGLEFAVELIDRFEIDAEVFEFTSDDVVRSGITAEWVRAFESIGR